MDKESSKLLTFNSAFGQYSFCRLLYGIHSASEIFQAQIAKIIEGTKSSQDNILISSETLEVQKKVSSRLRENGLKLN